MPAAVAAYISTATLTAASVVTAAQITAMTYAAFAVGSVAVGNHQRRKAKQKAIAAYNAGLEDRLISVPTTMGARSRCYGRVRNSDGVLFRATRGTNKEFYTMFIAVAGHEIDAFEQVYFNDKLVTWDAGTGYVQTEPYSKVGRETVSTATSLNGSGAFSANVGAVDGSGSVVYVGTDGQDVLMPTTTAGGAVSASGGPANQAVRVTYQTASSSSKARLRFFTGAAGQNVGAVLSADFPSLITATDHRFAGIAGILVDLEFDPDVFPSGVPNITAVIRGARVFDPRTSTTAWTQNSALIARDWALYAYGGGCVSSDMVDTSFTAAANACDTATTITLPSGSTTMPAFTCGIVAKLGEDDPWQVFLEIVESMAGKTGWTGGLLRVVAGSYRTPVETITEDWLSGKDDIQIVPEPPADEAVNVYRAQIADSAQAYNAVQAPEVRAATYITADGRELAREISLGGVTDTSHAQHVCSIMLRDTRNGLSVVLPLNLRAFRLELFDVVSVTLPRFGWSAKTFEVVDWRFSLNGGVSATLKETAAAIYTPDASFAVLDVTPNTQLPNPFVVPTPGSLTVTSAASALADGSAQTRVSVSWTVPADRSVTGNGSIELQYWPAATALPAGDWLTAPAIPGNSGTTTLTGLRSGSVYVLRARFVNALGIRGLWGVQTVHRVADVQSAEFAATKVWQWSAGTVDGWSATGATLTPGVGSLTITSAGTDPALRVSGLSINGAQNPRVRMRLRRVAGAGGWEGALFYVTGGHGESASYYKAVPNLLALGGPFLILEWDMSALTAGGSDWTSNTITALRFDLGGLNGDGFQIDWVAVGYVGAATEGAIWGQTVQGQPADPELLNSYQVIGQNLLPESDQMARVMFAGGGSIYNPNGATLAGPFSVEESGYGLASYQLLGNRSKVGFLYQSNRHTGTANMDQLDPAGNSIAAMSPYLFRVDVVPGARMAIALDGNGHRCYWRCAVIFYTSANAAISTTWGSFAAPAAAVTNVLANLQRSEAVFTVPATAATALVYLVKYNTISGETSSYTFYARPQIEVIAVNAQSASPYSSGPVGVIGTDQLSDGAATGQYLTTDAGPIAVTGNSGFTPNSRRKRYTAKSLTFTATITGNVFVECVALATAVTAAGPTWYYEYSVDMSSTSHPGDALPAQDLYEEAVPQSTTDIKQLNMSRRFPTIAGRTYSVAFAAAVLDNTGTLNFTNIDLSVQEIRR